MKLTSIRMITTNLKPLVQFYEQITGSSAQWYTDDFAEIVTSTITLAIGSTRTMSLFGEGLVTTGTNTNVIIEFQVGNVDEEFERIKDITSQIVQAPTTMPWGNRSLLFRDPDGNLINFFTPVTADAIRKFS
jgi:predicted enzyme related to lactoylglutathione lyase